MTTSKSTECTYICIVTFKTAIYCIHLRVVCGLLVVGVTCAEDFALAKDTCIQVGQYFQVQYHISTHRDSEHRGLQNGM